MSDDALQQHQEILDQLAEMGVDLSEPRLIEFAIDAEDPDTIDEVASALTDAGYEIDIQFDDFDDEEEGDTADEDEEIPSWTIYVLLTLLPRAQELAAKVDEINAVIAPFGAFVDGWGTDIEEEGEEAEAEG